MICPKCKCEYRKGFTRCSDCKIDLANELPVGIKKKRNKFEFKVMIKQDTMLFKTLIRIGYLLIIVVALFLSMSLLDYEFPKWTDMVTKIFFILYLLGGMLISYIYEIPIFNPQLSSWFENYKIGVIDFISPVVFILFVLYLYC